MIRRLQRRNAGDRGLENVLGLIRVVGVEAKDLAQVGPARGPQLQSIGLCRAVRFLMRIDAALAKPLEPHSAHEPAARVRRAAVGEYLVIDINGRIGFRE